MITPNAKCIVNGKKVNEIALWVNQFLKMSNEELDVVDANNAPGRRWFLTGKVSSIDSGSTEDGDRNNLGGTSGNAAGTGGGGAGNRDQLNMDAGAGAGGGPIGGGGGNAGDNLVNPPIGINNPQGAPIADPKTGKAISGTGSNLTGGRPMSPAGGALKDTRGEGGGAFGGGTDEFGNELRPDGTRVTPGGMPTDRSSGGGGLPGAPPRGGGGGQTSSGPSLDPTTAKEMLASGDALPSKNGKIDYSKLSDDQKQQVANGRSQKQYDDQRKKEDARQPGESNAEFLARKAKEDPVKYGDTLRRQLEQDMYFEKLREAEQLSQNLGLNFDYGNFNKQWDYRSKQRKKEVARLANQMMGR